MPMRVAIATCLICCAVSVASADSWTLLSTNGPGPRNGAAMAWDAQHGWLILVGGETDTGELKADVWRFDVAAGQWSQVAMSGKGPGASRDQTVLVDSGRHRAVVYGGWGAHSAEVWVFNIGATATWQMLDAGVGGPGRRFGQAGIFDGPNDRALIYGGSLCDAFRTDISDTWEYRFSGGGWHCLSTGAGGGRSGVALCLDAVRGRLLRMGGRHFVAGSCGSVVAAMDQTIWTLPLGAPTAWQQLTTQGVAVGTSDLCAAPDAQTGRVVVFGGVSRSDCVSGCNALNEAMSGSMGWLHFDATSWWEWPQVTPGPSPRGHYGWALDDAGRRLYVFGGGGIQRTQGASCLDDRRTCATSGELWVYQMTGGSGGGGCPFVDVQGDSGWVVDNSVLGRSASGSLGLDSYRLRQTPAAPSGLAYLRLREDEEELTTLDRVRLVVVDHDSAATVFADGETPLIGGRLGAYRVTTAGGLDVTSSVDGSTPGSLGFLGGPGDTLFVQMSRPGVAGAATVFEAQGGGGAGILSSDPKNDYLRFDPRDGLARQGASRATRSSLASISVDATWLDSTGIVVQTPDGSGGWRELTHVYPREFNSDQVIDSLGFGSSQLVFVGHHRVTFVGSVLPTAAPGTTTTVLPPASAMHSRLGNVLSAVTTAGTTTELASGDTLAMSFSMPAPRPDKVRDFLLLTNGVYTSDAPYARIHPSRAPMPASFSLGQNAPNPFMGRTSISFALPAASRVTLEVFDLLGRRVRTLTDQEWPAGYHQVQWDCRDAGGNPIRSGVFLYRMRAGAFTDHKRMVVLQ
jgi:hypothetical protein